MPILKQSPVAHSKKRPRLDRAMISAPLGDFRHTMHIGRGGDAFGDTSFLSNHGGPKANGLASDVSGSPERLSLSGADSGPFELLSPPGRGNGVLQRPATSTPDGGYVGRHGLETAEQPPQAPPNGAGWDLHQKISLESPALEYGESLLSFQLDLGPSILDEVLGVMDRDWDSIKGLEQVPVRTESTSPARHPLHHMVDDEDDEEDDEDLGQGYSFEDEQDEEIGL
ncbi:cdc42 effector protein 5 [Paroedura picta]|uniref:cdc42 effector protein 5 n=1 Tax=Paroedura picta TaxID=143630 RepID=UPI0040560591